MGTLAVGDSLAGYRLDAILGQGGMGCVYRATHLRLGRQVAVKVLADALSAQDEFVSRFLSEARIVNDVRHPNIVDISDFIEQDSPRRVAYVMELVSGPTLSGVLKERVLDPLQVVHVTLQLASALSAVHAVGVVHRDLKPDNILVTGDLESALSSVPAVKVLDFGIAKSNEPSAQHKTVTGSIMGTPAYMAPEQVAAMPVSPGTDIYALGEILYEMLAGQRLFRGEQMQLLRSKIMGEIPPLLLPEGLPSRERLEALIRATLTFEPEARPSMADVVRELDAVLAEWGATPVRAAPLPRSVSEIVRPPPRSSPDVALTPANLASVAKSAAELGLERPGYGRWIAGGLVAATIAALVAVYLTRAEPSSSPLTEAQVAALSASRGSDAPAAAERERTAVDTAAATAPTPTAAGSPSAPATSATPAPEAAPTVAPTDATELAPTPSAGSAIAAAPSSDATTTPRASPSAPPRAARKPARKAAAPPADAPADARESGPLKRKQLPSW